MNLILNPIRFCLESIKLSLFQKRNKEHFSRLKIMRKRENKNDNLFWRQSWKQLGWVQFSRIFAKRHDMLFHREVN